MAGNSFLLRGWSITLIVAIFTFTTKNFNHIYLWFVIFVILVFWVLDSYYLFQERRLRCLYEEVRNKPENDIDFSMKPPENHCKKCTWFSSVRFSGFLVFYGLMLLITVGILLSTYINISVILK